MRKELEAVYRENLARLLRTATAITGDVDVAAEAVHDAFVGLLRGAAGYRGDAPVEAWAWRAVINASLHHRRARRSAPATLPDLVAVTNGGGHAEMDAVRSIVAALPERQRLVLFLRYYADLDYGAIADTLEIATGTVGAALNAAHTALRAQLVKEVPVD